MNTPNTVVTYGTSITAWVKTQSYLLIVPVYCRQTSKTTSLDFVDGGQMILWTRIEYQQCKKQNVHINSVG